MQETNNINDPIMVSGLFRYKKTKYFQPPNNRTAKMIQILITFE